MPHSSTTLLLNCCCLSVYHLPISSVCVPIQHSTHFVVFPSILPSSFCHFVNMWWLYYLFVYVLPSGPWGAATNYNSVKTERVKRCVLIRTWVWVSVYLPQAGWHTVHFSCTLFPWCWYLSPHRLFNSTVTDLKARSQRKTIHLDRCSPQVKSHRWLRW